MPSKPNNLLDVPAQRSRATRTNVILGTATPIQLDAVELWDLLFALDQGAPQVLGKPFDGGEWLREESIQFLTGERPWPAERHESLGPVPQPAAARRRACRIPGHPQRCGIGHERGGRAALR